MNSRVQPWASHARSRSPVAPSTVAIASSAIVARAISSGSAPAGQVAARRGPFSSHVSRGTRGASEAAPENWLIGAPQGRLRYYQRVSISDEGQPVLTADRRQVISSVDREIITSAFVYVAVEGHMFYLQFVPKALAPIDSRFREIDRGPE